jgi:hypothetical protein
MSYINNIKLIKFGQIFGISQNSPYLCSREDRLRLSNLKQALIAFGLHCLCNIKRQFSFSYCIRFRFVIWFIKSIQGSLR